MYNFESEFYDTKQQVNENCTKHLQFSMVFCLLYILRHSRFFFIVSIVKIAVHVVGQRIFPHVKSIVCCLSLARTCLHMKMRMSQYDTLYYYMAKFMSGLYAQNGAF